MTDHRSKAVEFLVEASGADYQPRAREYAARMAHVHATLAVAEQQRIANLIAFWQLHTPRSAAESLEHRHIEVHQLYSEELDVEEEISKGLGLS